MDYSIVIPVFNTEKVKLKILLDSLINAYSFLNFKFNVEVVFVDDGSSNHETLLFLSNLNCEKFQCRAIFQGINQGRSVARNVGIDNAQGKFIGFLDSDDWVTPNYFKIISGSIQNNTVDFFTFSYSINGVKVYKLKNSTYKSFHYYSICSSVYRKDKIISNSIRFDENMSAGEDISFILKVISSGMKSFHTNEIIFNYCYDYKSYGKGNSLIMRFMRKIFYSIKYPLLNCLFKEKIFSANV